MPIHDWTQVEAGLFHNFHQHWTISLCDALNLGVLPSDYLALVEQRTGRPITDVLTLRLKPAAGDAESSPAGLAVATAPPKARVVQQSDAEVYARITNRISVRTKRGKVVAVIEIVSPGNKHSKSELRSFVEKSVDFLRAGVHLLVIDLFPPGRRDPQGIHPLIWDEIEDQDFALPPGKPLTLASYMTDELVTAYVENVGVGDTLPDMPLFLTPDRYVPAPLEATYQTAWSVFPRALKGLLESS